MTTILQPIAQSSLIDQNYFRRYAPGFVPDGPTDNRDGPSPAAPAPSPVPRRFINYLCLGAAMFGLSVFFVVREIQHSHDLYRMSQMVAASETQTRELRDQLRLSKAREATLEAKLQALESQMHPTEVAQADNTLSR